MKKNFDVYKNKGWYIGLTIAFFIVSLLFFLWKQELFIFSVSIDSDKFGQFGEFFGGVLGTIFALISILFLINTFKQQQRITNENEVLVNTQIFNDLFFELLNLYQAQTKELQDNDQYEGEENGDKLLITESYDNKDFFDYNKRKIQKAFITESSYSRNNRNAKNAFSLFYLKHKSKIAIYYRTLYRIFDLIDSSVLLESSKKKYAKIIRAQLTESELFFLRYNAMKYYGENFIYYLNRYNVLKHLPHFELLEFKSWWKVLSDEEKTSIDSLFYIIKDLIKEMVGKEGTIKKRVPIASTKYLMNITLINHIDLSFEMKINKNVSNTTNEYLGFEKYSNEDIQALLDCFIKEIIIYSNFGKFNKRSELEFYSFPLIGKSKGLVTIQSGVKNKLDNNLILRYQEKGNKTTCLNL